MCLAIPGRVLEVFREDGILMARIDFGGVRKRACLEAVPEAKPGDFVTVHVGYALQRIDEQEAERIFLLLGKIGELDELESSS